MPEPLTFLGQMDNALAWMIAGWATYITIWTVSKFGSM